MFSKYDCETCTSVLKKKRGCFGETASVEFQWEDLDGRKQKICPRRPLMNGTGWFSSILMYFRQWESGFLPEEGGINRQPGKFAELMTTMKIVVDKVSEIKQERDRKQKEMEKNRGNTGKVKR